MLTPNLPHVCGSQRGSDSCSRHSSFRRSVRYPGAAASPKSGASEFKLPELGENISQGDLVRLMIAPGTKVSEGQPVMELETDKAVVEVPSSVSGVVKDVKVKEGEKIKVGQVIFTLEGGAPASGGHARRAMLRSNMFPDSMERAWHFRRRFAPRARRRSRRCPPTSRSRRRRAFSMPAQLGKVAGTEHRQPIPAAPHVRRFAREVGVDIYEVKGTGPGRPHQRR